VKKALLCLLLCACQPKLSYPECKVDPDCAEHGQVCVSGFCKECRDDQGCRPSTPLCREAICVALPVAPEKPKPLEPVVQPCDSDSDCSGGAACVDRQCKVQGGLDSQASRKFGNCKLNAVYFGFDDITLSREARQAVADDWQCLQQNSYRRVLLSGHSDERGTTEYNLALGERRAEAVRKYLTGLGAEARRLKTLSYGKERPADSGHDDAAYARNRRVELIPEP
jgi:peptidoglycan-associated lipoprotein